MKRVLIVLVALAVSWGCATREGAVRDSTQVESRMIKMTALEVVGEGQDQEIHVQADGPIPYTIYKPGDPYTVVVELPGVGLEGVAEEKMEFAEGNITSIIPQAINKPNQLVRLELTLAAPVELVAKRQGDVLVLRAPAEEAPATAVAQTTAPAEENLPQKAEAGEGEAPAVVEGVVGTTVSGAADKIVDVMVSEADGKTLVRIEGNGHIAGDVFSLSDDRIVVDLPNVTTDLQYVTVSSPPLDRVRLGQHRDKVRVVLDVHGKVTWRVQEEGSALIVALSPVAGTAAEDRVAGVVPEVPAAGVSEARDAAEARPYVTVKRPKGQALATAESLRAEVREPVKESAGETEAMECGTPDKATNPCITLEFQNYDVVQILRLIAEVRNMNLVVHPGVQATIPALRLTNVPVKKAQEQVLKLAELSFKEEGNILRVAPAAVFAKEQEDIVRVQQAEDDAKEKARPLVEKVIRINYGNAKDLQKQVADAKILSGRGDITVDERTNQLIVKDVAEKVDNVQTLVNTIDRPKAQVQIATRIVEVAVNNRQDLGINWTATLLGNPAYGDEPTQMRFRNARGSYATELSSNVSFDAVDPALQMMLGSIADTYSLGLRIDALETLGNGKTISNPKIVTLDKEEATITQGEQIPYQTVSQEGTQTSFKDASLTLKVKPTIAPNGYIQVEVEIDNDVRGDDTPAGPIINTSRARTRALVKSGETMVIGGVYKTVRNTSYRQVPLLGDIPGLGWLFKSKAEVEQQRELMIFLTPMIVEEAI